MNQMELFGDPSADALRRAQEDGQIDSEMAIVLAALKRHPGCTARELQAYIDAEFAGAAVAHKRMSALESRRLVRRNGTRPWNGGRHDR